MGIPIEAVKQIARAIAVANGSPAPDQWADSVAAAYQGDTVTTQAEPEPVPLENISVPADTSSAQLAV